MRTLFRMSLAVGLLALTTTAFAQQPLIGQIRNPDAVVGNGDDCDTYDVIPNGGEFYAVKLDGNGYNDWLVSLEGKGTNFFLGMGPGDINGAGFLLSPNWDRGDIPAHVTHIFITFPDGSLWYDARAMNGAFMGNHARQELGVSQIASRVGDKIEVSATDDTANPGNAAQFPYGGGTAANQAAGTGGIEVAFGGVHELGAGDGDDLGGCSIGLPTGGGAENDARDPDSPTGGALMGYNIYRMAGSAGSPPAAGDWTADHFVYFLPIDFDGTAGDDTPGAPGTPAPAETTGHGDLAGLQNPDSMPVNGDEALLFQDFSGGYDASTSMPVARSVGTAPDSNTDYWYAMQPVVRGDISDWTDISLAGSNRGDLTMDWGGAAGADAVDMNPSDGDGPEFISPQADFGIGGLGLTNSGNPLLSAPVFYDSSVALPALGEVDLSATLRNSQVSIELTTGMQAGNVQGYNVYRVVGDSQLKINDTLIVATGGTGNVYKLTDEATQRGRRGGRVSAQYVVETVYNDGSESTIDGPFTVGVHRGSSRRGR